MKSLHDIKVFLETAKLGSLSAAARSLDQTPAAISRTIQRLETELEVPLFIRSTRKLRLSPQGELFLPRCQQAMLIFEQGIDELTEKDQELAGNINLSMPSDTGRGVIMPLIDEFLALHPKVSVHVHLSDSYADLYEQNVDVALRIGEPEDSNMIAIPLYKENYRILCASPEYIESHPKITQPEDLQQHNCLCFALNQKLHNRWHFIQHESQQQLVVKVNGNRKTSDGQMVRQWALNGHGVAYKSRLDVLQDIREGRLMTLAQQWRGEHAPLYMIFTDRSQFSGLVKALKEFLQTRLKALS
ncbi:LysR family transcriptional regulator [Vibrio breoganii]|uniref:LysR family transcriptional regulator n=1 Tax=Vibrio breoganii TaxID=553239 RepID=UPI0002FBDDD7|nr:LysR family transcriptional regulator [Vibrio breoganii]OED93353.1 LysR family transcriptional regulator [Vibrio breoganii ZF-55]OED93719.1 LysR family transcriptional regulator [Vibrio breoganii ZF-29]PMG83129.1 LysR family transcriptional regulator [Vibrio breoganii]PMK44065.1 LysR family transcriptional regulator [Vibrio breoganii]PMK53240.1 LysR family transcriptional regulator [Vibrio breoganii]